MIGWVRVDESFFRVNSLTLERGGFTVAFTAHGPAPATSGRLRLFTPDREPVTEWADGETTHVNIPALGPLDRYDLTWHLHITQFNRGGKT